MPGPAAIANAVADALADDDVEITEVPIRSAALIVVALAVGAISIIILGLMLRESQRLTRAVAGLVYQESDRIRILLGGP